jgi:hypothetical protein
MTTLLATLLLAAGGQTIDREPTPEPPEDELKTERYVLFVWKLGRGAMAATMLEAPVYMGSGPPYEAYPTYWYRDGNRVYERKAFGEDVRLVAVFMIEYHRPKEKTK